MQDLKRPIKKRVFQCWLTDEEKRLKKKRNDPVCEAKLLRKFGGLNFYDPDTKTIFTVHARESALGGISWVCGTWGEGGGPTGRSSLAILVGVAL